MEPEVVPGTPAGETETADHSGGREVKRPRGELQPDLSGEIPIPSADGTLNPPEIQTTPTSSTSVPIPSGASSSSGVKRTYSESTANSPGASGNGVKRSHDESFMRDDEEQPGTRARLSALIAGLRGVNAAEDDEVFQW